MTKLTETVMQESAPENIDDAKGILYGVKVIGLTSANGRQYPENTLRMAVPLYSGRKSYANHPEPGKVNHDRNVRDWIGTFRSPRFVDSKGVFADLHLRKKSDLFEGIIEAAHDFPTDVGFSHVAEGDTRRDGGSEVVDKIKEVCSVDLVSDPATTNGFFESKQGAPGTLQEFIDAVPKNIPAAQRTKLIEDITTAWPATGGPAANPEFQITLALLNAVQELSRSIMDANSKNAQAEADAAAAKSAADKKAAEDKAKAAGNNGPPDPNAPPTLEAMQRRLDLADAKAILLESGRAAKDEKIRALQIETLADVKDGERRKSLLESWPKAGEAKLRESRPFDRPGSSPPATGGEGDKEAASLKAYESRFEESAKSARERIAKRRAG